jgi:hypothetical protein
VLSGEAGDGPDADLDAGVELFAAHVPDALVRRGGLARPSAVHNLGRDEHAPEHFGHTRRDLDPELLGERVRIERRLLNLKSTTMRFFRST